MERPNVGLTRTLLAGLSARVPLCTLRYTQGVVSMAAIKVGVREFR